MQIDKVKDYYSTEVFREEHFVREEKITLRGEEILLRAESEDCVFRNDDGEPEASIFVQAWIRADVPSEDRPVMFCWNGGPGSASSALQLECFGPYTMPKDENGKFLPDAVLDEEGLIDAVDLVYLDQVGVGYSRLVKKELAEKYYSIDGDARCYAFCIAKWLKDHGRLFSPVYLCGESYGTIRACRVVAELGRSPYSESRMVMGLPPAGVILVGNATAMNPSDEDDMLCPGLELTAAMMPAMAATNCYHHSEGKPDVRVFADEAWDFARRELVPAWFAGQDIDPAEKKDLAEKLEHYTGVGKDYWLSHDLKIASEDDFMLKVAADKGCRVDLYDTRMLTPLHAAYNSIGSAENIPLKVMNARLAPKQGIETERMYYTGNLTCYPVWGRKTEDLGSLTRTHIQCLKNYMESNAGARVLFASGLFDICTHAGNTRYQLSHAGLPTERVTSKEYAGGHGVYSSEEGKTEFLRDVRSMVCGKGKI